jgi:bifunctional UDP-N-acetylglucosamine pyrophosphorylase / glucosamine-1-phosphate N-acetyltransferase
MRLIVDIEESPTTRPTQAAANWTAIIPAAGRASRLNASTPKILYPVLQKPILHWLVALLRPLCREMIFVLSPNGVDAVRPELERSLPTGSQIVIQDEPTGMADAIRLCETRTKTPYTLVMWGDQITPRRETLAACMNLLESTSEIQATIPTIVREKPYIHFVRDANQRIVEVYQARESDRQVAEGESDCGAFFFRSEGLFRVLRETRGDPAHQGNKTKEHNFLTVIPAFHDARGALATVRLHDPDESCGINTVADAQAVEAILRKRQA